MSFEIKDHDLAGRLGRIKTKSGVIETPFLLPVINPNVQSVAPREMKEEMGINAVITNAYILKKHFGEFVIEKGLHNFLDFDGVIMTDSGAYQLLIYGEVDVTPEVIVRYQEEIGSDIATILDVPTGWKADRAKAEFTVEETIRRAEGLLKVKSREDILWVGPIQGGLHLDLLAMSAERIGKLPFQIHALGSPTAVMERYHFQELVDMIATAKSRLPEERPLHLFGAGHPFMLALAVSMGCDLFDSAAYDIYARDGRYMTSWGTIKLKDLEWLPCSCPTCVGKEPSDLLELPDEERIRAVAQHNLYTGLSEVKRIKQSIREGRLWEHLEVRARSHPYLLSALKRLRKYTDLLERSSPLMKRRGFFFFDHSSLARPEVTRYAKRLSERYKPPKNKEVLLLIPKLKFKPFATSDEHKDLLRRAEEFLGRDASSIHICLYDAPFGVIASELEETYPLSHYTVAEPIDMETIDFVANSVRRYILEKPYKIALLLYRKGILGESVSEAFMGACRKAEIASAKQVLLESWSEDTIRKILMWIRAKLQWLERKRHRI